MTDTVRVEVVKKRNETSMSLIRRFSRRAQGAGIVRMMRKKRYYDRPLSKNVEHKKKLVRLDKRAKFEEAVKLGKIDLSAPRPRRR
jgi:ribosomal protein S21